MSKHQSEQAFFVQSHRERLGQLFAQHVLDLGGIAVSHREGIDSLDDINGLERSLGRTSRDVGNRLSESEKEIAKSLKISYEDLLDIIQASDKDVFRRIVKESNSPAFGPSEALYRNMRNVSDREAADAIRAGMDHVIYERLKKEAASPAFGPSEAIFRNLRHASHDNVKQAIHAGFDTDVYSRLKKEAASPAFGPSEAIYRNLRHASHDNVKQAMHSAVDEDIFERIKKEAASPAFGPSEARHRHMRSVSHPRIARRYDDYLSQKYPTKQKASRPDYRSSFSDSRAESETRRREREEEEIRRQAAESAKRLWEEQQRQRESESQRPQSVDSRVKDIIRRVSDPSSQKTLSLEDPVNIARVIKTVELLRSQEPGITDRQIYVKYRKKIETHDADPKLTRSFQILQNLMGGNIGGKLPF